MVILFPPGKFFKNQAKNGLFGHFLENFDQKITFFSARVLPLPPKKIEVGRPNMDVVKLYKHGCPKVMLVGQLKISPNSKLFLPTVMVVFLTRVEISCKIT